MSYQRGGRQGGGYNTDDSKGWSTVGRRPPPPPGPPPPGPPSRGGSGRCRGGGDNYGSSRSFEGTPDYPAPSRGYRRAGGPPRGRGGRGGGQWQSRGAEDGILGGSPGCPKTYDLRVEPCAIRAPNVNEAAKPVSVYTNLMRLHINPNAPDMYRYQVTVGNDDPNLTQRELEQRWRDNNIARRRQEQGRGRGRARGRARGRGYGRGAPLVEDEVTVAPVPYDDRLREKVLTRDEKWLLLRDAFASRKENIIWVYDGEHILLMNQLEEESEFDQRFEGRSYHVQVTPLGSAPLKIRQYAQGVDFKDRSYREDTTQMVQIMLNHCARASNAIAHGMSRFFTPDGSERITRALSLFYGRTQNLLPLTRMVGGKKESFWALNLDVVGSVGIQEQSFIKLVESLTQEHVSDRPLSEASVDTVNAFLNRLSKKLQIRVAYTNIHYRCSAIVGMNSVTHSFPSRDSTEMITLKDYVESRHKTKISLPRLNLVQGTNEKLLFPMEHVIVPTQMLRYNMPDNHRAFLVNAMTRCPAWKCQTLRDLFFKLPHNQYRELGMKFDETMMRANGAMLPPPALEYGNMAIMKPSNGTWNMGGLKVYKAVNVRSWSYVHFDRQNEGRHIDFIKGLIQHAKSMGLQIDRPRSVECSPEYREESIINWLINEYRVHPNDRMVMFGIPKDGNKRIYETIKQVAARKTVTQCFIPDNSGPFRKKGEAQWYANFILKINAKLGGTNGRILKSKNSITPAVFGNDRSCMIVGVDVTHPTATAGDTEVTPSVLGVVGSKPDNYCQYFNSCRPLAPKTEVVTDLHIDIKNILENWKAEAKSLPTRIYYFRDGVSDGQLPQIRDIEISEIRKAFASMGGSPKVAITCIVIQKRHHVRFFSSPTATQNLPAGLLITEDIVHPSKFPNFWLLSHPGIKGTSHPARYFVVMNETQDKMEDIHTLCYEMCHIYTRCTRAVSYPAPTYYAHLLADVAKKMIKDVIAAKRKPNRRFQRSVEEQDEMIQNVCTFATQLDQRLPEDQLNVGMFFV